MILEPIDLSTTYYVLLTVKKECSIYEFGKDRFPDYQPDRGFGYYKHTDDDFKPIQLHKRVIVMVCLRIRVCELHMFITRISPLMPHQ